MHVFLIALDGWVCAIPLHVFHTVVPAILLSIIANESPTRDVVTTEPTLDHVFDPWHTALILLHCFCSGAGDVFPLFSEFFWHLQHIARDKAVVLSEDIRSQGSLGRLGIAAIPGHDEADLWGRDVVPDQGFCCHVNLLALNEGRGAFPPHAAKKMACIRGKPGCLDDNRCQGSSEQGRSDLSRPRYSRP